MVRATQRKSVSTIEFPLTGEYVALCDLLKCAGIAGSAGAGKHLVAQGMVRVDGQPEDRKTAKIRVGQIVECDGVRVIVGTAKATQ
jgi:ribosome-associated protein